MRIRITPVLALLASAGLGLTTLAAGSPQGSGQKGANVQQAPKAVQDSAKTKCVQDLQLASRLISYGREHKHAESLILAAQIIHTTPTEPLKCEFSVDGPKTDNKSTKTPLWSSAKDLMAEAKKLANSPQAETMWQATDKMMQEVTRGAVGGPAADSFSIGPGQTINWNPINFKADEKAVVFIDLGVGNNSRMTLEVFDGNNNVVVADNIPGDFYECVWYPKVTGPFRFRLTNLDQSTYNCGLITN